MTVVHSDLGSYHNGMFPACSAAIARNSSSFRSNTKLNIVVQFFGFFIGMKCGWCVQWRKSVAMTTLSSYSNTDENYSLGKDTGFLNVSFVLQRKIEVNRRKSKLPKLCRPIDHTAVVSSSPPGQVLTKYIFTLSLPVIHSNNIG